MASLLDEAVSASRGGPIGAGLLAEAIGGPAPRAPSARAAQDIGDSIKAGLQSSSMGLIVRGKMPDVVLPEDAPWYHRAMSGVGNVVGDFLPGVAGAVMGTPAGLVGQAAGGFGVPMAIRDALIHAYENGYGGTWDEVRDIGLAALKGGAKGAIVGAATFGAGKLVGGAMTGAAKLNIAVAQGTAEVATMTTAMSALEGKVPTAQDFMDNAILLGGLKGAVGAAKALKRIYAETGKTPAEVGADAAADPKLKADILARAAADPDKARAQALAKLAQAQFEAARLKEENASIGEVQMARNAAKAAEKEYAAVLEATKTPEPYVQLALEERIKASLDKDNRPALVAALIGEDMGKPSKEVSKLLNFDYIVDKETADGVMRAIVEVWGKEIEAKRRGEVPTGQTIAEGVDLIKGEKLRPYEAGMGGTPAEVVARNFLARGFMERAKQMGAEWDALPAGERSVGAHLKMLAAVEQAALAASDALGLRAEMGRAMQMYGHMKRNGESVLGEARALVESYGKIGKDPTSLAGMLRSMNDPQQMAKFAGEIAEATTLQKVLEVYRANLFSGFQTHLANPIGNITALAVDIVRAPVSAALFAAEAASRGEPVKFAQVKARAIAPIMGWILGARDGVIAAGEVFTRKTEVLDKVEVNKLANTGALGQYTGTVFRALQAEDMIFRVPAERAKAYVMAIDRAVREGFNPETREGQAMVQRYTNNPQYGLSLEAAQKVTTAIEQAGGEAVFAQRLGPRSEAIQRALSGSVGQFLFPAFRTPANLLSWAVQHTPGLNFLSGRWREDFAAGGERKAQALSRVAIGGGLAALAYYMAEQGMITGSGIYDKEQGGTKRGAGHQPNSLFIGGEYYSFERIEPVAKILTLAADLIEIGRVTKDEEDKAKIAMMLVMGFGNATVSTTYMSGLANAIKAVTDPNRNAENFFEGYAAGLVPKAVGQVVVAADPFKREVDGVMDAIQSQTPFLREKLLPKRDVWGDAVKNQKLFGVLPVATSAAATEKVKTEAMRLQLAIADAPREFIESGPFKQKDRDIRLTQEQRDIMREVRGKTAMQILVPYVNSPDWDKIPDYAQAGVYKDALAIARKAGEFAALAPDAPARQEMRQKILERIRRESSEATAR